MSTMALEQQLQQLYLLTTGMIEAAQAGQWDAVTKREGQRHALVEALSQQPFPQPLPPTMATKVQAIREADTQLLGLARAKMVEISDALQSFRAGRRVRHTYGRR